MRRRGGGLRGRIARAGDCALLGLVLLMVGAVAARAAEFTIAPLRIALDRESRTSQIEIRNAAQQPLRVQMQAMAWTQDAAGRDQYAESEGLLFFPKVLEIPAGESRIVRLGVKAAPIAQEDAYRLYVEELPGPIQSAQPGASVRVFLRVGVPVFVAPAAPKLAGEVRGLDAANGSAHLAVANTGNVSLAADRMALVGLARDGRELFSKPLQERYVLAGITKQIDTEIPRELCPQIAALEAVVDAEPLALKRRVDVTAASCR
jgi:fimbrial chaperone protein